MKSKITKLDHQLSNWMYKHGTLSLRVSLAIVFIWFGAFKALGMSPAEELIKKTVY